MSEAICQDSDDKLICFFCHEVRQEQKYRIQSHEWETTWLRKCSESLCHLLDVDELNVSFFESGYYCPECLKLVREVDFTVRTVASLQIRLSKLKTKIAEFLIAGFDDTHHETDTVCDTLSNQTSSRPPSPKQEKFDIGDDIERLHALGCVTTVFVPDLCQPQIENLEWNSIDITARTNEMDCDQNSYPLEDGDYFLSSSYNCSLGDKPHKSIDSMNWQKEPKKIASLFPRTETNDDEKLFESNQALFSPPLPKIIDEATNGKDIVKSWLSNPFQVYLGLSLAENQLDSCGILNPERDRLNSQFGIIDRLRARIGRQRGESLNITMFECSLCHFRCDSNEALESHLQMNHENIGHHRRDVGDIEHTQGQKQDTDNQNPLYLTQRDQDILPNYVNQRFKARTPYKAKRKKSFIPNHLEILDNASHPFMCTLCGTGFSNRLNYSRHACKNRERSHQCDYCGKGFSSLHYVSIHQKMVHHAEFQFKCSFCYRKYGRQQEVERHQKRHTSTSGFKCVLRGCSSPNFDTMEELRAHVAGPLHDTTQRYRVCEICGYVSNGMCGKGLMKEHMRIHTGEKPIKCRYCDEVFRTFSLRHFHEKKRHAQTHDQDVLLLTDMD